jgi:hypothetical protein
MAAGDLTDLATAKIAANIPSASAGDTDQILGALISAISAYVPEAIGRAILAADYQESYLGNGKQAILLRQRPIISISQIAWQGLTLSAAGDPISGESGIWNDGRNAWLEGYCFPAGLPIRISYRAGYETTPPDISYAVAELVAEAYARRSHVGELSRSQGGQTTISFDARKMHAAIADKLSGYQIGAPC